MRLSNEVDVKQYAVREQFVRHDSPAPVPKKAVENN
jgi:hypothetical protein